MTPDILDRLDEQWRRFDFGPEARFTEDGVFIKTPAYIAFLEARKLIEEVRHELFEAVKGWRPIRTFFESEPETPMVLLFGPHPEAGEPAIMLGYWDDDDRAWYREGQRDPAIEPVKWMPVGEVTRLASEYVAVPRID